MPMLLGVCKAHRRHLLLYLYHPAAKKRNHVLQLGSSPSR